MLDWLIELFDLSKMLDGIMIALGLAAVYAGVIITGSLIRSLALVGGGGILFAGRFLHSRHRYNNGNSSEVVNVTLNTTRDARLSIDTVVADHLLSEVWPNAYHVHRLKTAAKNCTDTDPIIKFSSNNGTRRDEYRATYDPLISMVAERCTNNNSIDLALGRPVEEHRFILALTFEKKCDIRAQHFRVMMVAEKELMNFPMSISPFERVEHANRFETLKTIAEQYRTNPERFGVVKVWRPRVVSGACNE